MVPPALAGSVLEVLDREGARSWLGERWRTAPLWDGAPNWSDGPSLEPLWLDPCDPGIEVRHRVVLDEPGVAHAPRVLVKTAPWGSSGRNGYLAAWARPAGSTEWQWALLVWEDKYESSAGDRAWRATRMPRIWVASWVTYDKGRLKPAAPQIWSGPVDEERAFLSAALVEAIDVLA